LEKYLQKENLDKEFSDQSKWYDQERNYVSRGEVVNRIDNNHKGLKKVDAKFFMITINYSKKELDFMVKKYPTIESISEIKKKYCREVMKIYADNFNKDLSSKDILFFAIDETNRYHKGDSPEVQTGIQKQGSTKDGHNDHTHIIVSRKDKDQRYKLSPLTNHMDTQNGAVKGGFNRVDFKLSCEVSFDKMISYDREFEEKAEYLIKKSRGETMTNEKGVKTINEISTEPLIDFKPIHFNIPIKVQIEEEIIQPKTDMVEDAQIIKPQEKLIENKPKVQTPKLIQKKKDNNRGQGMGF
jgi:hypothetical protein